MRILASADIHGVMSVFEWLAEQTARQNADLLVLAGDLLDVDSEDEQRKQARNIIAVLKTLRVPVFYIMGNDDFIPLNYEDQRIRPLDGRRLQYGEYNFVGYQYSLPFIGGIYTKTEDQIAGDIQSLEPLVDGNSVLVTHSPVFGVLDRTASGTHAGSHSLRELITRKPPLLHIHGHIHNCFGREGNHLNVAAAATRRAMCLELPSLAHLIIQDPCTRCDG